MKESLEILQAICTEIVPSLGTIKGADGVSGTAGGDTELPVNPDLWRFFLPPPQVPQYVQRDINAHERELLRILCDALQGDLEKGLHKFDDCYSSYSEAVPWDTELGEAIHDFAAETDFFEPNEENRADTGTLFGPDDLRRLICRLLALAPASTTGE
jgi:hypothetical protein